MTKSTRRWLIFAVVVFVVGSLVGYVGGTAWWFLHAVATRLNEYHGPVTPVSAREERELAVAFWTGFGVVAGAVWVGCTLIGLGVSYVYRWIRRTRRDRTVPESVL